MRCISTDDAGQYDDHHTNQAAPSNPQQRHPTSRPQGSHALAALDLARNPAIEDRRLQHTRVVRYGDSLNDGGVNDGGDENPEAIGAQKWHGGLFNDLPPYHNRAFSNGINGGELEKWEFNKLGVEYSNYSRGGATAASYPFSLTARIVRSNFETQVKKSIKDLDIDRDTMAIVSLGPNDYVTVSGGSVEKTIDAYKKQLDVLIKKGVKDIVIVGTPDVTKTPKKFSSKKAEKLRDQVKSHNDEMQLLIRDLNKKHSDRGVKITFFDSRKALDDLQIEAREQKYDVSEPLHKRGNFQIPARLGLRKKTPKNPDAKKFFTDKLHPTQDVYHAMTNRLRNHILENYGVKKDDEDEKGIVTMRF